MIQIFSGFLGFWLLIASFSLASLNANERPNILLIVADDLGWSDLGCYGNELIDTPNIDKLAVEGMRFTDAYAMPVCTPTRVSIQSGKNTATLEIQHPNPHNRPYGKLLTPRQYWRLPLEETTIAEALAQGGYISYHTGKWGSGRKRQDHGYVENPEGSPTGPYAERVLQFEKSNPEKRLGQQVRQATRFIENNKDRPFFCMLSPVQVHTPLETRADLVAKYKHRFSQQRTSINPIYAGMVEVFDEAVGIMLDVIDALDLAENTLVLVTSDNGGVVNEMGYVPGGWPEIVTHNWPLRSEKGTLYEGGVRIPLIMRLPGRIAPDSVTGERAACYDYWPTFCDFAGIPYDPASRDGLSLRPVLERNASLDRDTLYWHYPRYHHSTPTSAIIHGDYKLLHFYEDGRNELYNLAEDIGEQFDLSEKLPGTTDKLKKKLDTWLTSVNAAIPEPNPNFDERNQLIWGTRDPQTWHEQLALPE